MIRQRTLTTALCGYFLLCLPIEAALIRYDFDSGFFETIRFFDVNQGRTITASIDPENSFKIERSFTIDDSLLPFPLMGTTLDICRRLCSSRDTQYTLESSAEFYEEISASDPTFAEGLRPLATEAISSYSFDENGDIAEWGIFGEGDDVFSFNTDGNFFWPDFLRSQTTYRSESGGTWTRTVLPSPVPLPAGGLMLLGGLGLIGLFGNVRTKKRREVIA